MEFLVILGPPGSGKGTLSRRLQDAYGFYPLSTGEEIRKCMANPASELGCASAPYMDRGDYIPDDLALQLFYEILSPLPLSSRVALDGFPRTVPQADAFSGWLKERQYSLLGCVYLDLPVELAVKRMEGRLVCPDCRGTFPLVAGHPTGARCDVCGGRLMPREDDDPVRMHQRLKRHAQMTLPLRDWFAARQQLRILDAGRGTEELRQEIENMFQL